METLSPCGVINSNQANSKLFYNLYPNYLVPTNLTLVVPRIKKKLYLSDSIYIKRFELILRKKFKNTNIDSTACTRDKVPLNIDLKNPASGLKQFADEFGDVKTCRNKCKIDQFLLTQYRTEIEQLVEIASQLPKNTNTRGFINIANNLKEILTTGATACDCKRCEKLGDAVIALDAPRRMQLEHTDNSFDYLCPPINQPHYKHPSENRIVINVSIDNSEQ